MNIISIFENFPTQANCIAHLERVRWRGSPTCPYCSSDRVSAMPKEARHHCNNCKTSFSVTVGTIFHRTHLPLQKWLLAVSLVLNAKKGIREVELIPGYKGLVDLSRRSGNISTVYARVVYANDAFKYHYGLEPDLTHTPTRQEDAGTLIAVYAAAHLRDGGRQFEVMLTREVESIREQSKKRNKGSESPAWSEHTAEMYKKTALRRLCKMLPVSVELQKAVALDEHQEAGIPQDLSAILDVESTPVPCVSVKAEDKQLAVQPQPAVEPILEPTTPESGTTPADPGEAADAVILAEWQPAIAKYATVDECLKSGTYAKSLKLDPATTTEILRLIDARTEDINRIGAQGVTNE